MTDAEVDRVLLRNLQMLVGTRLDNTVGICINVTTLLHQGMIKGFLPDDCSLNTRTQQRIKSIIKDLNYHDVNYPVAHPTKSNKDAYDSLENHWDSKTVYGQNRFKLLKEMIEYLRK